MGRKLETSDSHGHFKVKAESLVREEQVKMKIYLYFWLSLPSILWTNKTHGRGHCETDPPEYAREKHKHPSLADEVDQHRLICLTNLSPGTDLLTGLALNFLETYFWRINQ